MQDCPRIRYSEMLFVPLYSSSKLAGYTNPRKRNAVPTPLSEQYEEPSIR
jgi:hypothetical protein